MIIDWLSFSLPFHESRYLASDQPSALWKIPEAIKDHSRLLFRVVDQMAVMEWCNARAPYSHAWRSPDGLTLYVNPTLDHMLLEFSGQGCQWLRESGMQLAVLEAVEDRVTRIDVALDIMDVSPDEIVREGYSGRFRAHSRMTSASGVTHYVGSPKSDRFCRVYRYNPPHPRSELCRVEAVHRREYAKILARAMISEGRSAMKGAIGAYRFKWLENRDFVYDDLPTVPIDKSGGKTVAWLIKQVAPAIKRAIRENVIEDPMKFFRENFLPEESP